MNVLVKTTLLITVGIVIGLGINTLLSNESTSSIQDSTADEPLYWVAPMDDNYRRDKPGQSPMGMDLVAVYAEKKPENKILYWVAPMDDNYRRDKPGQSPMGMDLVPFYGNQVSDAGPGTVRISPLVVNNIGVKTGEVTQGILDTVISTTGYVGFNQNDMMSMVPRVEGWVDTLYVKAVGEPIAKNMPLYSLYSPELVNAQEEYLLAVKRNNQSLIKAAQERLEALNLSTNFIKKLNKTKKIQQKITFYTERSGVVSQLNVQQGSFVKPSDSILSMVSLDKVWVEAQVFENQANEVKIGQRVSMTVTAVANQEWQGKVDYIYPVLDVKTRTLKVRIVLDNANKLLKPNMFSQVTIHTINNKVELLVPKGAVIRTGKQNRVVLALDEGHFKSVAVTVGSYDETSAVILSGLVLGDKVVTSAQFLLDSESSKSSDFKRMDVSTRDMSSQNMSAMPNMKKQPDLATVFGVIKSINLGENTLVIAREAIEKWGRSAATVDFSVADSIDLRQFSAQDKVYLSFYFDGENFIITMLMEASAMNKMQAMKMATNMSENM